MNANLREQTAMGRFELICERYINATERERNIILSFLDEKDRQIFLNGCGLYHLFTDETFYKTIQQAICEKIWESEHGTKEETV